MAEAMPTHAIPTGGIEGVSVLEDGSWALLRFADSPVGVTVPRDTLVRLVALAIDACAERLTETGETSPVQAVRLGRFSVGAAEGGRVVLGLQTDNGAGSVSFDLSRATATQLAETLNGLLAAT